ncbi:hypothetical protein BJY52DRAFT_1217862, partial [Lactarius psammicola]
MATAQDAEHAQISLNSPGPSASQNAGSCRIAESQESTSPLLSVEVTVLRAENVPHIKKRFGLKRRFYVTVVNLATMRKTESVQIDGQMVRWNQRLGAFSTQWPSHITLCLYAKRLAQRDDLVGTREIPVPVASQSDVPFVLAHGDRTAGQSTQSITLYLTITVSANIPPPIVPNNPEMPAKGDGTPAEETTKPSIVTDSGGPIQSSAPEHVLPSPDPLPVEGSTPMTHAKASPTEKATIALRRADEAKKPIDRKKTWKGVVSRIQWMMDTVSPIAELHPFAKMAYGLVTAIPEALLKQYER